MNHATKCGLLTAYRAKNKTLSSLEAAELWLWQHLGTENPKLVRKAKHCTGRCSKWQRLKLLTNHSPWFAINPHAGQILFQMHLCNSPVHHCDERQVGRLQNGRTGNQQVGQFLKP